MSDESREVVKKVDEDWKERVQREKGQASSAKQAAAFSPESRQAGPAPKEKRPEPGPQARTRPAGQEQSEFAFFLSTLSMQAMIALGEIPHPVTRQSQIDLEQARYLIDVLGMLKEKTAGNLNGDEIALLDNLLYELRMQYVSKVDQGRPL
ncbi:MAG: DUF1844 domain-containing protein [Candidatus Omnitrophica bacterium]|nr:DUF1844 domain-containing protein [Candidatus Omnitrophota bacterium]